MPAQDKDSITEATARQFAAQFDSDRDRALQHFGRFMAQKGQAERLLQRLNKLGRSDVVSAATATVPYGPKTTVLLVIERARALMHSGEAQLAHSLLGDMGRTRGADYAFQYHAGRVYFDGGMYQEALECFDRAIRLKPTAEAAELAFLSLLKLQRFEEAASAMARILRVGSFRHGLSEDIAHLLRHIQPGNVDPDLAFALSVLPAPDSLSYAPALLPHLVATDQLDCVLSVISRMSTDACDWEDGVLASLVPYLRRHNRIDELLHVYRQLDIESTLAEKHFAGHLDSLPKERFTRALIPETAGFLSAVSSDDMQHYTGLVEDFSRSADPETGLSIIASLSAIVPKERFQEFYLRERRALGCLTNFIVYKLGAREDVMASITRLIALCAAPALKAALKGPALDSVIDALRMAGCMEAAAPGSKLARFREGYFCFWVERRTFQGIESFAGSSEFCAVAERYFKDTAARRGSIGTPVGSELAARLAQKGTTIHGDRSLDAMTSHALSRDRVESVVGHLLDEDDFCWWYVTRVAGARKAPPACLAPDILQYLNTAVSFDNALFLPMTRFLKAFWRRATKDRSAFDLNSTIDRTLFVLSLCAHELPQSESYLPMLAPLLRPQGIASRVLVALDAAALPEAVCGVPHANRPASQNRDSQQHVLVIGHASKDTGLGRNFRMLKEGLTRAGAIVAGLDFDASAETFNEALARWHDRSAADPIVVLAVNANDVPDAFATDRRGILNTCYCAGFFLWEVSQAPAVQKLGIELVDEIWAPTKYVADIYSPLAPTYVVGKGLFADNEALPISQEDAAKGSPFTFVTVFDFDSSIERKNPLAAILAFQDAFRVDEDVALIVKTSNVNPRHWSNVSMHWERMLAATVGDSRVRIVTERFTDEQMTALMRGADCVVSLHRSEGFGYLISDAMALGKPVIATDYSGNADFTSERTAYPVKYNLVPAPDGAARWRCEGAVWADADIADAAAKMREVFDNYDLARQRAARARADIQERYAMDAFRVALEVRLSAIRNRSMGTGKRKDT
jgi:glycosyltransferase involved in cell wall biosynthesis